MLVWNKGLWKRRVNREEGHILIKHHTSLPWKISPIAQWKNGGIICASGDTKVTDTTSKPVSSAKGAFGDTAEGRNKKLLVFVSTLF